MDFIVNDLGDPDCVGVLWDLFHANIEDADYKKSIVIMGEKLKHIHLADSNRMFPEYGHTDFAAILKEVKMAGFKEYCSFECLNLRPETLYWIKRGSGWKRCGIYRG